MTDEQTPENEQTSDSENLKPAESGQKKEKKNQTSLVKWSIFTESDTRALVGKAVKKTSYKQNEWIDRVLREAATQELTKKAQPPAKPEDLAADIVQRFVDQMREDQAQMTAQQNEVIQQQGEQIKALAQVINDNRPISIKELLFGRSKGKAAE